MFLTSCKVAYELTVVFLYTYYTVDGDVHITTKAYGQQCIQQNTKARLNKMFAYVAAVICSYASESACVLALSCEFISQWRVSQRPDRQQRCNISQRTCIAN